MSIKDMLLSVWPFNRVERGEPTVHIKLNSDENYLDQLNRITERLTKAVELLRGGPVETVLSIEGYVCVQNILLPSESYLYKGQLIWKVKHANGQVAFYRNCDLSVDGMRVIGYEVGTLDLLFMHGQIKENRLLQTKEFHSNLTVRVVGG